MRKIVPEGMSETIISRFEGYGASATNATRQFKASGWMFTPGIVFLLLGIGLIVAPRFLLAIGALFLLTLGLAFVMIAWKILKFKRKIEAYAKSFDGRVFVQGVNAKSMNAKNIFEGQDGLSEADSKKIVFH